MAANPNKKMRGNVCEYNLKILKYILMDMIWLDNLNENTLSKKSAMTAPPPEKKANTKGQKKKTQNEADPDHLMEFDLAF